MIRLLQSLQRWGTRLTMPFFTGWRVPVRLLRGTARGSGQEVRLLAAGHPRWSSYVCQRLFSAEPEVESIVHVPVWSLQKHLNQRQSEAALVLVGIDRISARLFLEQSYLAVPHLVSSWMDVPADPQALGPHSGKSGSDFRRVKRHGYESHLSAAAEDFDLFYDQFYKPYLDGRHAVAMLMSPRWALRLVFRFGWIQWVTQKGGRVAGDLVIRQGRDYVPIVTGLRDGRQDLLRQGALAALYVHSIHHARSLGCTRILLGGSQPSLHDGVLRYKGKWLDGLCAHDGPVSGNIVLLLRWRQLSGPVADFLSHTALIHHEQGGYSALWVFPRDVPLTAETLRKECRALQVNGLHRFRILLPGKTPADFVCPPGVCLIELSAMTQSRVEHIISLKSDSRALI